MDNSNNSNKSNNSNYSNNSNIESDIDILENNENSEKTQESKSMLPVTFDTDVTFVTVRSVTGVIAELPKPVSTLDQVRYYLYQNPNQSISSISKAIDKEYDAVKTELSPKRNPDIFAVTSKEGKKNIYNLSQNERKNFDELIKNKTDQKNVQQKIEVEKQKRKQEIEILIQEIKEIISEAELYERLDVNTYKFDLQKIKEQRTSLFDRILDFPEKTLECFNSAFEDLGLKGVKIRFSNLDAVQPKSITNLRACDLDTLVRVNGRVGSLSDIRPQIVNAKFECPNCGALLTILQVDNKFREPSRCTCGWKSSFRIISKELIDTARIILEESDIVINQKNVNVFIQDSLTEPSEIEKVAPGRDISIIGVLKEVPIPLKNGASSTRFDIAIKCYDLTELEPDLKIESLDESEIQEFKELSNEINQDGLKVLTSSIAPDVVGNENIKNAIILQAAQKRNSVKKQTRDKSNILFVGDPGVSKSIMTDFAAKITTGSQKGSCTGSTHIGLTASVEKDNVYGWNIKPGLLARARDLLVLSEFNLITEEDKPKLQEGLNEKHITINKASIHTEIPVTAGVLADANPIYGKFNPNEDIIRQFNLFPPIANRFDLIFAIRDVVNLDNDKLIAVAIINREENRTLVKYDTEFLRKFFLYIKNQPEPIISNELAEKIIELYPELRQAKNDQINARFNEALIRLCKASAKLRLSTICEPKDLKIVISVMKDSIYYHNILDSPDHLKIAGRLQ